MSVNNRYPQLIPTADCADLGTVFINKNKFTVGRANENSLVLPYVHISRHHCVLKYNDSSWSITDLSSSGTHINGSLITKNIPQNIKHNDEIGLGSCQNGFVFKFITEIDVLAPSKKIKVDQLHQTNNTGLDAADESTKNKISEEYSNYIEKIKEKYEIEKASLLSELKAKDHIQNEILIQKKEIEDSLKHEIQAKQDHVHNENSLAKKLCELQETVRELTEREKQRLIEIESIKGRQELEKQEIVNKLKAELKCKEKTIQETLQSNISKLQNEKQKLLTNIKKYRGKYGDMRKKFDFYMKQCKQVSKDLEATVSKKKLLEEQLVNVNSKNEENQQNLYAKENMLVNFEKTMEVELQCPICNELFVKAIVLNCSHSFCTYCLREWRKKKNDCPVCRSVITVESKNLVIDNLIDKMVENFSMDMKKERQEIVDARLALEPKNKKGKQNVKKSQRRYQTSYSYYSRVPNRFLVLEPTAGAPSTSTAAVGSTVYANEDRVDSLLSSSSSSESSNYDSSFTEISDNHISDSDGVVWDEGDDPQFSNLPMRYYSGYGYCWKCGSVDHWAYGCPLRYRD